MEAPVRRNPAWINQEGIITEVTPGIQNKKKRGEDSFAKAWREN